MKKCKRHTIDLSSSIGVCATCLRERLFTLAASNAASENHDSDQISFPRSVSPYVAPRKSDSVGGTSSNSRFFSTPQTVVVGRLTESSSSEKVFESGRSFKKKRSGLSRFSNYFRTRSDDFDLRNRDSTFSPSSSWFSKILSIRSKKQSTTTCYIEDLIASESSNQPRQRFCRGMSPATVTDNDRESIDESPVTQRRAAVIGTPGRRKSTTIGKSVSRMAVCLSPLVRAKPNCSSSNWKGRFPPDFGYSGELKSPAKPHISTASSFCANRSKKLVDLGRVDPRR